MHKKILLLRLMRTAVRVIDWALPPKYYRRAKPIIIQSG